MIDGLSSRVRSSPVGDPAAGGFVVDVDLAIAQGRTAALVGPNGAGKSTLVRVLAGLVPCEYGHIDVNGRTLLDTESGVFVPPERRRIGIADQDNLLFPHMSVAQNIIFGIPHDRHNASISSSELMHRFGISELADRDVGSLSGGEAQLVSIVRAVASDPEVLILDEPMAALDVTTRARIRLVVAGILREFAGPALVVTHDPAEAFLLGDTVIVMEDGRVTQRGTDNELANNPASGYVADLVGINLVKGSALNGIVTSGNASLVASDRSTKGPVAALIHPRAVGLFPQRPDGSARNVWQGRVVHVESMGNVVRVQVDGPIPLTAEVTADGASAAGLVPGGPIWVSVKATEISLRPVDDA